jgi:hypothetical protein
MEARCVMSLTERVAAGLCLGNIPERRAWRGSHFCSNECHREYRRQRRSWRATRSCRLCGRATPKRRQLVDVPSEHTPTVEVIQ